MVSIILSIYIKNISKIYYNCLYFTHIIISLHNIIFINKLSLPNHFQIHKYWDIFICGKYQSKYIYINNILSLPNGSY